MTSLTGRLTLLFILVFTVMFTVLGLIIQHNVEQEFEKQDFKQLDDKLHTAAGLVTNLQASGKWTLVDKIMDTALGAHDNIMIRIETTAGDTIFSDRPFSSPFDNNSLLDKPGHTEHLSWRSDDQEYRGAALAMYEPKSVIISVAMDTSRQSSFLDHFSTRLLEVMLWATLCSGFLAWWVSRQGLAPLRSMGSSAKQITASHLDVRVPLERMPFELHNLTLELNRMFDRLQDSFNRLNNFSSDLAHELRSPISNLTTQMQVSLSQQRSAEEYRDVLASNLEELDKLSRMIADMLFLAKAENGMELPSSEEIRLEQEVEKLFEFYEALAEDREITLATSGSGTISGDRIMVDRAISNLLSNAMRHTYKDGRIDVDISTHQDNVRISISNDGDLIPQADIPYLFDRFYRGDRSRSHSGNESTGLGLSITQAIIKAHNGSIEVTSDDEGTCFILIFPSIQ
ncbi:heavy metal sensor histidine kinase [Marinobacterium lutimaris]|uniref:Sensor protein n=1 Tax=Marinobacterium lutimaris TaxID=568106 RepID=A0A1H6BET0_9GAMM|nr:heavy metal sensor histidine kinase [Marinobacterium lutimaris]SEG59084.1 two-component system, OmpR family, heavy metal sensor histidine kinase CusS [Marinobacterium lutimaris]